jgi:hypothetical protein
MGDMPGLIGAAMIVVIVIAAYLFEIKDKPADYSEAEIKDSIEQGVKLGRMQLHGAMILCLLALAFVTYIESVFVWRSSPTPSMAVGSLIGVLVIDGARFFLPRTLSGHHSSFQLRVKLSQIVVLLCVLTSMFITAAYAAIYIYPDEVFLETVPGHRSLHEIDREISRRSLRVSKDAWYQSDACEDDAWRECVPIITLREERKRAIAAQTTPRARRSRSGSGRFSFEGLVRALLLVALAWLAILISTLLPVVVQQAWAKAGEERKAPQPSAQ